MDDARCRSPRPLLAALLVLPALLAPARSARADSPPEVSAELSVDQPVLAAATPLAFSPGIAFDGKSYLVVWLDARREQQGVGNPILDLFGARVSAAGVLLDVGGFLIARTGFTLGNSAPLAPAIAWNGTSYLVVWEDHRSDPPKTPLGEGGQIYAARVSPAGKVLDPGGIPVTPNGSGEQRPSVVSDGKGWLVSWVRLKSPLAVPAALVDAGGAVQSVGTVLTTAQPLQPPVAWAWNGTTYLAAWGEQGIPFKGLPSTVRAARVSAKGVLVDQKPIALDTQSAMLGTPVAASDGDRFLVAWGDGAGHTRTRRIDGSGNVVDKTTQVPFAMPAKGGDESLSFDGQRYVMAWADTRKDQPPYDTVYAGRIGSDGQAVDPTGVELSSQGALPLTQVHPSVASGPAGALAVWTQVDHSKPNLFQVIEGARLDAAGKAPDAAGGLFVSAASNPEREPSVASDGTGYMAVWSDFRKELSGAYSMVYAARLDASGAMLDPAGIPVGVAGSYDQPAIAFDGTSYLVTWFTAAAGKVSLVAKRISPKGVVLDASPIPLITSDGLLGSPRSARVAFGGGVFLVAYASQRPNDWNIWATRVTPAGASLDPDGFLVTVAAGDQLAPDVAWNGTRFLVAWQDPRNGMNGSDIYGARVGADGTVLDPASIAISTAPGRQLAPSVACRGGGCLVAWQDGRGGDFDIYGARVDKQGGVVDADGIALGQAPGDQVRPAVVSRGDGGGASGYALAWIDGRAGAGPEAEVYGNRFDGAVKDAAGFALSTTAAITSRVAIASVGKGSELALYSRLDLAPGLGSDRVHGRLVGAPPAGSDGGGVADAAGSGDAGVGTAGDAGVGMGGDAGVGTGGDAGVGMGGDVGTAPDAARAGMNGGGCSAAWSGGRPTLGGAALLGLALLMAGAANRSRRERRRRRESTKAR